MKDCLSSSLTFRIASMLVVAIALLQASVLVGSGKASAQSPMMMPTSSAMPSAMPSMPAFFDDGMSRGGGMYFMTCADKNPFGYYSLSSMPWLYHFDMGWEYFMDANNPAHGAFLWDPKMDVVFYTDPQMFPFMGILERELGTTTRPTRI